MEDVHINRSYWTLKIVYGVVPIIAGLDKFTNLLTDWKQYLAPVVLRAIPLAPATFMHMVGVVEIVAGIIVLSRWTRVGAYIVCAWLVCIALNLLIKGSFDVAVRDIVMAFGAYVLSELAIVHVPHAAARPTEARPTRLQPTA
jgi:uncharacterized membrane protein YphA (DoxX/SURF4 family)